MRDSKPSFRIIPVPSRIAVLASGGLDSSVLLADLAQRGRHVFPVYVRAGLRWERDELSALRRFVKTLRGVRVEQVTMLTLPMTRSLENSLLTA